MNSARRSAERTALRDVQNLKVGERLTIKEQKTGNVRAVTVNQLVADALTALLASLEPIDDDQQLFVGEKRGTRLTVSGYGLMVKHWCTSAGLEGQYSSHSLRKTFFLPLSINQVGCTGSSPPPQAEDRTGSN